MARDFDTKLQDTADALVDQAKSVWIFIDAGSDEAPMGGLRQVRVDGRNFPLIGDPGVFIREFDGKNLVTGTADLAVNSPSAHRPVAVSEESLVHRFSDLLETGQTVVVYDALPVYELNDVNSPTRLIPKLAVYARIGVGDMSTHAVITI